MADKKVLVNDEAAEALQRLTRTTKDVIKTAMFDIAGISVIIATAFLALDALDLNKDIFNSWADFLISFVPFWLASWLLDDNYYTKGLFKAKQTEKYTNAIKTYSERAESITGAQLDVLGEFCDEYNTVALIKLQSNILRKRAISFERFDTVTYDEEGNKLAPLKSLSRKELKLLYNKATVNCIIHAQNATVKGINENLLLSNVRSSDDTNIGKNEHEIHAKRRAAAGIKYALMMIAFGLVAIKDIQNWSWAIAIFVLFKMIWIFFKTYSAYYKGYNDVTIDLISYVCRKNDILKQFEHWYQNRQSKITE